MKELHVSNVPFTATEGELKRFLEGLVSTPGGISHCDLKREDLGVIHKGFGFVTFAEDEVADYFFAISTDCPRLLQFQGRQLRFNLSKRSVAHVSDISISRLAATSLAMGCLSDGTFIRLWRTDAMVEMEVDFQDRKLLLLLKYGQNQYVHSGFDVNKGRRYKLEFRFKYLISVQRVRLAGRHCQQILLELLNPPQIYAKADHSDMDNLTYRFSHGVGLASNRPRSQQNPWVRTVDFTDGCIIGQSLFYLLEFPADSVELSTVAENLEKFHLFKQEIRTLTLRDAFSYSDAPAGALVPLVKRPRGVEISFKLMFKLNQLVQVGNFCGPDLKPLFFFLLSSTQEETALWILQKLVDTMEMVDDPERWFHRRLQAIKDLELVPSSASIRLEEGVIWVNRLLVSPTKVYCRGPEAEVSNRVTREYMDIIENFIRVSFVEEDWTNLSSTALSDSFQPGQKNDVYKRVVKFLKEGITLEDKKYEFLAFSPSQLRDQSVWMFAPKDGVTADLIRSWMGDFVGIRNVAKCAARMGQCFSSTTRTLRVDPSDIDYIDDIELETWFQKFCFSDGIGKISKDFAKKVARKCGSHGALPSAFQIRYRGYKGVVAVDPNSEFHLSLRPSMKKFESDHYDLEVINWTRRFPCYLNRQIITLLSTLGVEDYVFEQMQNDIVSKLNEMLNDSVVALDTLQMTSSRGSQQTATKLLRAGYSPRAEPYLMSLIQVFRAFQLLQLRTKSKILVGKGRTLMGCLDETATLEYGQVFVQVSANPGTGNSIDVGLNYLLSDADDEESTCVVTGEIVVAKNPCLHPGDVRILQGIDVPELRHMVDCVVFPQLGPRPHPNECSGSDLDGDLYFVTWDPLLVPPMVESPMNYFPAKPITLNRAVTMEDIQGFFADYMMSDTLGVISNAHVVHADKEPEMARHPKCLELAALFSVAVDFPKTGEPAVMHASLRPQRYPDFMEKADKQSYISKRVLGKLFRAVLGEASQESPISKITRVSVTSAFDKDLVWPGFQMFIEEAYDLKLWYDSKLVGLMNLYEIRTEAEALTGHILPFTKFYRRQPSELKERMSLAVKSLQQEALGWFKNGPYGPEDGSTYNIRESESFPKASAWYHVTYHADYIKKENSRKVYLLSFPWVLQDVLLDMKERNRRRYRHQESH